MSPESKVIAFPKGVPPVGPDDLQRLTANFVASISTASAAALLKGIDDLALAVDKVALLVQSIPQGDARLRAEADLEVLRGQLAAARALTEKI